MAQICIQHMQPWSQGGPGLNHTINPPAQLIRAIVTPFTNTQI